MFIVVLLTTTGKVCESYPSYEDARRRVDLFPADSLVGLPLIFQELPDGSQRVVRDDGKPLQWHRLPEMEDLSSEADEPIPLSEGADGSFGGGRWVQLDRPRDESWDDEPT